MGGGAGLGVSFCDVNIRAVSRLAWRTGLRPPDFAANRFFRRPDLTNDFLRRCGDGIVHAANARVQERIVEFTSGIMLREKLGKPGQLVMQETRVRRTDPVETVFPGVALAGACRGAFLFRQHCSFFRVKGVAIQHGRC